MANAGNVQVLTAPDGWPLWTSDVRPGREHDTTCLRAHDKESYLVACAWADDQTVGIVAFLSSRPQADRTAQFLEVRRAMTENTA